MTLIRLMAALLCWAAFCAGAAAQDSKPASPEAKARPRVALVLSGGGARGFAHIGVLRVLREQRIPIDMVVGTSMGSVVGGAFAAGASVAELESMARDTDWDALLSDRPPRDDLTFRRREEDLLLPSRIEFGVSREGATLPPAAASNAALEQALDRMLPPGTRQVPVHQLPLPFRSVASDLLTGELVELKETPLFMAMRASLAVPGVFAPVRVEKRLLADGGLVRNLPVDMARAMGADIVIAVNVGTPLSPEKELNSAIGVARQMINILTEQNVQRSIRELGGKDILVAPDLAGIGFMDFASHAKAIAAGEAAARALLPRLAQLALSSEDYAMLEDRRLATPTMSDGALPIASVKVSADGDINPETLVAQTGLAPGASFTRDAVRRAADLLYGRGDIARVETEVVDEGGARHVRVRAAEALWANNRVRLGLELASDFSDYNAFALKLMHVKSSLNRWGGELRSVARVGNERELGMQLWQPLGAGSPWYIMPGVQWSSSGADVFAEGRRVMRFGYRTGTAGLTLGRELGNWGDLQVGIARHKAGLRVTIPEDPATPTTIVYDTTQFLRYRIDTLDVLGFPTRGMLVDAHLERSPGDSAVQEGRLAQSTVVAMRAFRRGDWAGHVYGEWSHALEGTAPLSLGGFLRLSGTIPDSLEGRSIVFGRLAMARKIGALPTALGGTVRAGFSLEAGGVRSEGKNSHKQAVSAYLSVDTRFGPAYLGAGGTKDGDATLYLFLGPVW